MNDEEAKQIVKAAAGIVIDAVVNAIQNDGHIYGNRPCETCRAVSGIMGRPFGCYKYQEDLKKRKAR